MMALSATRGWVRCAAERDAEEEGGTRNRRRRSARTHLPDAASPAVPHDCCLSVAASSFGEAKRMTPEERRKRTIARASAQLRVACGRVEVRGKRGGIAVDDAQISRR